MIQELERNHRDFSRLLLQKHQSDNEEFIRGVRE